MWVRQFHRNHRLHLLTRAGSSKSLLSNFVLVSLQCPTAGLSHIVPDTGGLRRLETLLMVCVHVIAPALSGPASATPFIAWHPLHQYICPVVIIHAANVTRPIPIEPGSFLPTIGCVYSLAQYVLLFFSHVNTNLIHRSNLHKNSHIQIPPKYQPLRPTIDFRYSLCIYYASISDKVQVQYTYLLAV